MPSRATRCAGKCPIAVPAKSMLPRSRRKWPVMTLISVDLPEPFGPTSRGSCLPHIERHAFERLHTTEGLHHIRALEHGRVARAKPPRPCAAAE